jgi:nucleoid DNA-binding protein
MAKGMTKSDFIAALAEKTGMSKKDASGVMEAIAGIAVDQLKSSGELTLPGLVKMTAVHKPAQPERPGKNPFTGEAIMIKAKPATTVVKARPVKVLKDAIA